MFTRIYSGMFMSVLAAVLGCYLLYNTSYDIRFERYNQTMMSGMMALIAERFEQQPKQNQGRFLDIIAQLTGAQINQPKSHKIKTNMLSRLKQNKALYTQDDDQHHWWLSVTEDDSQGLIQLSFSELSEQQFRAHTLLLAAELSRDKNRPTLTELQRFSMAGLAVLPIEQLSIEKQLISRLKRNSVVVDYESQSYGKFSVYAPLPGEQVLRMSDIPVFNALPPMLVMTMIVITIAIIVIMSYLLVHRMDSRLQVIARSLNKMAGGDLAERVQLAGKDQIAHLAHRVNSMASQINELVDSQREMMQAISHDLRTPISRIRFRLDILNDLLQHEVVESKTEEIKRDVEELEALISEVLTHLKLSRSATINKQTVCMVPLVRDLSSQISLSYPAITFKSSNKALDESFEVDADPMLMRRLLQNLLTNAGKHAKQQVKTVVERCEDKLVVAVHDDGEGIPEQERSKIFEPFYRVDSSRNKQTGGYGLGLAIITKIAQLHDADIHVADSDLGGAVFTLSLPIAEAEDHG